MTESIEYYSELIGGNWNTTINIENTIKRLNDILSIKEETKNIFISNWVEESKYRYDTTLWVFTEHLTIECINFENILKTRELEFNVHNKEIFASAKIKYNIKQSSISISIPLSEKETSLKAVGGNLTHLVDIYKSMFLKNQQD